MMLSEGGGGRREEPYTFPTSLTPPALAPTSLTALPLPHPSYPSGPGTHLSDSPTLAPPLRVPMPWWSDSRLKPPDTCKDSLATSNLHAPPSLDPFLFTPSLYLIFVNMGKAKEAAC
ncbi:hypothetical protein Pmani_010602 [Petrolisthes manimaculis]|uniref:Uncharacterized protein n=1 Tax=Petrolisthes manimaculis TaxID=1843537 RepID=A0AAE1UCI3_9EUCA|nr:hypothetical protein Pmani_010602 [Petrolisthes manimaculis]